MASTHPRRAAPLRETSAPPSKPFARFDLVVLAPGDSLSGARLLASYGGATVVEPFETKGGAAGERMRRIVELHERILRALDGRAPLASLPAERELVRYGTALFEALFPGDARRLWDTARSRARHGAVELVFTSALDWIADKPWEFAYDPSRRAFLAHDGVTIIRNVFSAVPADPPRPRRSPLRVLLASARPSGTAHVATDEEAETLRAALSKRIASGGVLLDVLPRATAAALHARLREGHYDVLHFVGHGEYDVSSRTGALLLEDARGRPARLSARSLVSLVAGRGLLLAVLNACETGRGGRTDFLRGVAPALAAAGLPAVAANQYRVFDTAAIAFAAHFFTALAQGLPLSHAFREARVGLGYERGAEALDWAVPVLYARNPRAILCRPRKGH
jgi:hypothetical protein